MAYFDRFDIAAAYNTFAALYHSGGRDPMPGGDIFVRLSRLRYRPSDSDCDPDTMSETSYACVRVRSKPHFTGGGA
jgi:hypothetical protein